jgi:feruloyl esterase
MHRPSPALRPLFACAIALAIAACTSTGPQTPAAPAQASSPGNPQPVPAVAVPATPAAPPDACVGLAGLTVDASRIGLPSRGARVESAQRVAASAASLAADGTPRPALPAHCRVLGMLAPSDPAAPPIRFQLNLPADWNRKAVQFGGGGFNGVLVSGLGQVPSAPSDAPVPLARGYATFGTDSGHQAAAGVEPQAFALNDEALVNFAYASYKKVRDAAQAIIARYYGAAAARTYYVGSSEGGREGLSMAQRFPADYDGVFSRVPVINWVGLQSAGTRSGFHLRGPGWLNPAKVRLVHDAVLKACDALDGLADGIVSRYERCGQAFTPVTLRCRGGADAGDHCLSDGQVVAVGMLHAAYHFTFELANGVTAYPGWGYGGENLPGGWTLWWSGKSSPTTPASPDNGRQHLFGSGTVRYFFARDPSYDPINYYPVAFRERLRYVSGLMDATDPDLSAFMNRGGKLIVLEHSADYAQSPFAGIAYVESVRQRLGAANADRFLRLYVTPGADHGGQGVPHGVDMLSILDGWVDNGRAPADTLVQTAHDATPPFAVTSSRPLCRYPDYPHYQGGDPKQAGSFRCVPN